MQFPHEEALLSGVCECSTSQTASVGSGVFKRLNNRQQEATERKSTVSRRWVCLRLCPQSIVAYITWGGQVIREGGGSVCAEGVLVLYPAYAQTSLPRTTGVAKSNDSPNY